MSSSKKFARIALVQFGAATARRLLSRATVRSTLRGQARKLLTGSREKPYQLVPLVERAAECIVELLDGRIPNPPCIGIDGIAGSGKSTLGRSLARKLGLEWRTLFGREMDQSVKLEKGTIYENIRLFRTQDIDHFDAIIYIDIPVEMAKQRVMDRDRNGALADLLDFEKLKRIGDAAFEAAGGQELRIPDSPARMKIRPAGGFGLGRHLATRLREQGLEPAELCTEELLFLHCYGQAHKGIRPYIKFGAYKRDILVGLLTGLLVAFDGLS